MWQDADTAWRPGRPVSMKMCIALGKYAPSKLGAVISSPMAFHRLRLLWSFDSGPLFYHNPGVSTQDSVLSCYKPFPGREAGIWSLSQRTAEAVKCEEIDMHCRRSYGYRVALLLTSFFYNKFGYRL